MPCAFGLIADKFIEQPSLQSGHVHKGGKRCYVNQADRSIHMKD
jgi:hypothetical protein